MSDSRIATDRILSVQSHVAFGYVGGKAAVFPLQCMGYEVDVVNSVNFSNHSGYGRSGGSKATANDLTEMFESMEANGLLNPSRLLTGYIPGAEALNAVKEFAQKIKDKKPGLIYLMDPVIGDGGQLYVAPDVVPVYRSMLPLATIITPNYFEVETLTGIKLEDIDSLRRALTILHKEYRVPNVVISSMPLQEWLIDKLPNPIRPTSNSDTDSGYLLCLCSSTVNLAESSGNSDVHAQFVPLVPGYFSGVGDLFSALLIGHFENQDLLPSSSQEPPQTPLSYASSMALTKTHAVLTSTYRHTLTLPEEDREQTDTEKDAADPARRRRRMRGRELRLVQPEGQSIIRGADNVDVRKMDPWLDFWTV
ncbi:Ribokinase-like protein [Athelia psychrophila]|uniref:pyridoxal kinase n=1 Tax=Athelia psychrophila TaxID=1759441 RepID=A0A166RTN7_9AGAM|nr:Ribokinase-like protein [Fibularhizoctonia sp. CBS 109695]